MSPGFELPGVELPGFAPAAREQTALYRIGALVGTGGSATVHEAWRQGTRIALKRPRADIPGAADTLRREAVLLAGLCHPHVVTLIEAGSARLPAPDLPTLERSAPNLPTPDFRAPDFLAPDFLAPDFLAPDFLALEFLCGGSLQAIREPVADAAGLLAGVAAALDWLADRGIVHGDVKPANLLRDTAGRVKLIDFGAATGPAQDMDDMPRLAAPAFAAPERLLGQAPDRRDDIYSLAVVAYGLLTGRHPFGHDPLLAFDPPVRPAALHTDAWVALRAALAPSRADRPATAGELIAALAEPSRPGATRDRRPHPEGPVATGLPAPDSQTGPTPWPA